MILQIKQDTILFAACFAPILAGLFIKYAIPYLENMITKYFNVSEILQPYYVLVDLMLGIMTPLMFGFIGALVILGEVDDNITAYMSVTPLQTRGYLISRLIIPIGISFVINLAVIPLFSLSIKTLSFMLLLNIFSCILGLITALIIVTFSQNKVEGMAIGKLSTIILLGAFVPFFVSSKVQYFASVLPSYWLGRYSISENYWDIVIGMLLLGIWSLIIGKRFIKKLEL